MKINKFLTLSIIFVIIAVCISSFDDFFRDYLDDSIVILLFYIFGIIGIALGVIASRQHKRESNKFSIYSVLLVTFIAATILFLIAMPPCQCGSRPKARDAAIKSNLYSVESIATLIRDEENSYATFCNNLHTFNDKQAIYGNQLKTTEEAIISVLKKDIKPVCFASADSYCISTMLTGGDYYCIDATGFGSNVSKSCSSADKCPTQ